MPDESEALRVVEERLRAAPAEPLARALLAEAKELGASDLYGDVAVLVVHFARGRGLSLAEIVERPSTAIEVGHEVNAFRQTFVDYEEEDCEA